MEPDPDPYSSYLSFILLATGDFHLGLGFLFIFLFLLCSALVSGSEVAFFSLNSNDINSLKSENSATSRRILRLKEEPNKLLGTILIANNFINIAIVVLSYVLLREVFPEVIYSSWSNWFKENIGIRISESLFEGLINVVGITFLLVLFGEILPKVYASRNHRRMVNITVLPLSILSTIISPLSNALIASTNFIDRRLPGNGTTKTDLDKAIELTVGSDEKDKEEVDILKGILKFQDVSVTQIMKSRMDIVAVEKGQSYDELINLFRSSGYSRFPVYENELDQIVGIIYVKDFIGLMDKSKEFDWTKFIREKVLYVPESKNIYDLLKDFQAMKMHMAIVVDEFGGSSGLVTLEDVMEEVIGEIQDEFDSEGEIPFTKIDDHNYIFEGKALINDVCRLMDLPIDTFDEMKGESDSLAGLVLEVLGYIPRKNQIIQSKPYKFKIISANHRRIEEVQITLPKQNS